MKQQLREAEDEHQAMMKINKGKQNKKQQDSYVNHWHGKTQNITGKQVKHKTAKIKTRMRMQPTPMMKTKQKPKTNASKEMQPRQALYANYTHERRDNMGKNKVLQYRSKLKHQLRMRPKSRSKLRTKLTAK